MKDIGERMRSLTRVSQRARGFSRLLPPFGIKLLPALPVLLPFPPPCRARSRARRCRHGKRAFIGL